MRSKKLVLQTINEENLNEVLKVLKKKNLLLNRKKCGICAKNLTKEEIGGFLPFKDKDKVSPICNHISCILKASFLIMKYNGNGSPILEL